MSTETKSAEAGAHWSSPGFIENGFKPIVEVGIGTIVGRKITENGQTCFALVEIVSTPNAKEFEVKYQHNNESFMVSVKELYLLANVEDPSNYSNNNKYAVKRGDEVFAFKTSKNEGEWTTIGYPCQWRGHNDDKQEQFIKYKKVSKKKNNKNKKNAKDEWGNTATVPSNIACNFNIIPVVFRPLPLINSYDGKVLLLKLLEEERKENEAKEEEKKLIPVTILTGFLGSGKTTLLNNILNDTSHGMRFAIIENEFGEVGIDENVLSENVDEEIIEVMNGCICCTVRKDLVTSLTNLYEKIEKFDGVIIETTGLADPGPVCQTFFIDDGVRKMYKLDSVITVVDSKYILSRLAEEKPDGVENEAVEQVAFADKILLNKIDLSDEESLANIELKLRALNPTATIERTQQSIIDPSKLLNANAFALSRVLDFDPEFLEEAHDHLHDKTVTSVGIKEEIEVNMQLFNNWINRLVRQDGADLYRYKGVIAVKGFAKKFVFQGVGMLMNGVFEGKWGKNEKRISRFCFIGKNLDKEFYEKGFLACSVDQQLRFKIGDFVEANVGTFKLGKVIKVWDEGNAYRVEIQDENKTNVWAPIDIDTYIRAPINNK